LIVGWQADDQGELRVTNGGVKGCQKRQVGGPARRVAAEREREESSRKGCE